jgi:hypothetical protein
MEKKFFVVVHQYCMAKNKLQEEYQKRVKEDFDQTLITSPEEAVKCFKLLESNLNTLHWRCKPVKGSFQQPGIPSLPKNYFVDSLFTVTFYEVREVSNA